MSNFELKKFQLLTSKDMVLKAEINVNFTITSNDMVTAEINIIGERAEIMSTLDF
jgi:hypothetical protein